MKKQSNNNGVKNNNWETPEYILKYIRKQFFNGEDYFDPCPYDPKIKINGLNINWKKNNFVNPPYTRKEKENFIRKSFIEYIKGNKIVLLIPCSMEIGIFHKYLYPYGQIYLLEKRVKFKGFRSNGEYTEKHIGQNGSIICVLDKKLKPFIKPLSYVDLILNNS